MFRRGIKTPGRELKIRRAARYLEEIRGVWIVDETLSRVKTEKQKPRSKRRTKIVKIHAN